MRSSYGLCGVVYEVTFRIKPLEAIEFNYLPRPIKDLTEREVDGIIDALEGLDLLDGRPKGALPDAQTCRPGSGRSARSSPPADARCGTTPRPGSAGSSIAASRPRTAQERVAQTPGLPAASC